MSGKNYGLLAGYLDPTGRNWEDVIFQSGKAVLSQELNLGQDLDIGQAETLLRRDLPSGWLSDDFLNTSPNNVPFFVSSPGANALVLADNLTAHVNGWLLSITNTGTISTNTITFTAPPVAGTRTDLLFLEVWRILLSPAPSTVGKSPTGRIWGNGNVKNDPANDATLNYVDDILDATLGVESTKRVQIQYRLRVVPGVDLFTYPYGLDDPTVLANTVPTDATHPDGTPTAFNYGNQSVAGDSGLWVAGDGNPANGLGTVDGFMYAIPFMTVFRRNSAAFDPASNMNGALAVASTPPSDRPDGLFNDQFVLDDIADLRMAVSPTGWDYQEVLDKNLTYLLDNTLRSEWAQTTVGTVGHTPLYSNQIGGAPLGGGPLVGQFDAVCRSFSGRAINETIVIAIPAPGGGWVSSGTVTIYPSALPIYPYGVVNWASKAPTGAQIIDINNANWIGDTTAGKTVTYNALKSNRVVSVTGLGSNPVGGITITLGTLPGGLLGSTDPLYVELLVSYPPGPLGVGHGLTATPTAAFQATQTTFQVNNPTQLPNATPYYFDPALFTVDAFGKTYFNATPSLAVLDWTHREATLAYTTTLLPTLTMQADSETVNHSSFVMPERINSITYVHRNGAPLVGTVALDPSGRIVTFQNSSDYTSPGDNIEVSYTAIRPFPINNEQVTVYFDTRAPQTSRAVTGAFSLTVVPKCVSKALYTLTAGVSSHGYGFPFEQAYVQTGGMNDPSFLGSGAGEYQLTAGTNISISDFNADVGMIALPTYVGYTPNPESVTFSTPLLDNENRTFLSTVNGGHYQPNAYAQDLSDPKHHKNFLPFLAELTADSPPLGFKGQLVLVLLTRWADNDETNAVFFGASSTTAASVFRLRNNMLNRKA